MQQKEAFAPYGPERWSCKMRVTGLTRLAPSMYPSWNTRDQSQSHLRLCQLTLRNLPVENRFEDALKRERSEVTEGERMEAAHGEAEGKKDTGATPAEEVLIGTYSLGTTRELLQDLSEK